MKAKGAAIQGALALGALVAAYVTWQREPEAAPGEVVVLDLSRGELEKVRYEDDARWVELVRAEGDAVGIRHAQKAVAPKTPPKPAASADGGVADAGVASAPDAGSTPVVEHDDDHDHGPDETEPLSEPKATEKGSPARNVRGNERAEKLFARFAPMRAARSLGVLKDDKLKELGLVDSKRKLEIVGRGGATTFTISTASPTVGSTYLRNDKDGRVYLASRTDIADLQAAATGLVDRRLHTFKPNEFDGLTVKVGEKQRELVHQVEPGAPSGKLAPKKTPDKPDDFARNWHDKLWRVAVIDVLGKDEVPASGAPTVVLRVDYLNRGKPQGFFELAKGKNPNELFARSEHTAGWVQIQASAADLLKEGERVASGS
jgi:hypothetical protein